VFFLMRITAPEIADIVMAKHPRRQRVEHMRGFEA